jgi:tetratricopeptide (TPR) repeat protein
VGQLERAAESCQRSAELYEALNDPLKAAAAYSNLGVIAFERADWLGAEGAYEQALKLQLSTADAYGQATTNCNLADLYWRLGRLEDALSCARAGLTIAQYSRAEYLEALAHENLGAIYLRKSELGPAPREHLQAAWNLLVKHDIQELRSEVQSLLAEAYLREGQPDRAEQAARRALEIAREQGSLPDEGVARRVLGWVYRAQGDPGRAEVQLKASLTALKGERSCYEMAQTLKRLAALYAQDTSRHAEARAALEEAGAIFGGLGAELDLRETRAVARALA